MNYFAIGICVGYVITATITWKTFDYFNTTVLSAVATTGFQYHMKKIGMSFFVVPLAVLIILGILFLGDDKKSNDNQNKSAITQLEKKTEEVIEASKSDNPTPAITSDINSKKDHDDQAKVYTKEEIDQLEEKAQYHGDDPTIRARLGLPPKIAN